MSYTYRDSSLHRVTYTDIRTLALTYCQSWLVPVFGVPVIDMLLLYLWSTFHLLEEWKMKGCLMSKCTAKKEKVLKQKIFEKIAWIESHHLHLQWKFKLLAGKFTWGNIAEYCWVMSTNILLSKVCWQCPAMFCL